MRVFYRKKAREFEAGHKWKEAEKAYLQGEEVDSAINMYKKARLYDQMIRLVSQHRKDNLTQAHMMVAQALEGEGNLREAEKHYTDAKDWKAAVQMYRANGSWEDALRVAKMFGGAQASKQVAYAWAVTLGGDEGAQLLRKLGLLEAAIEYAVESGAFQQAFELTRAGAKHKLPEVHLKYAMFLEDEGRFQEAEAEFISAGKPREAIDMYCHNQVGGCDTGLWLMEAACICVPLPTFMFDCPSHLHPTPTHTTTNKSTNECIQHPPPPQEWDSAQRIADQYDPTATQDILAAQARVAIERKQFQVGGALPAVEPQLLDTWGHTGVELCSLMGCSLALINAQRC